MERKRYLDKIKDFETKLNLKNLKSHLKEYSVNIELHGICDFYNQFDMDNNLTRDLTPELDEYLFNKIDKIDYIPNMTVNLYCPANLDVDDETLITACKNHFEEKTIMQFDKNNKTLNKWIVSMIGGCFFLGLCLLASNLLRSPELADKSFCTVLSEGFGIIGWVAVWEPAGYLLYYRRDDKRILRNYLILSTAKYNIIRK